MQVRKNGLVYAVESQKQEQSTEVALSEEQLQDIRSDIAKFSNGFDGNNFLDTYSFKYELQGSILQDSGAVSYLEAQQALSQDNSQDSAQDGVLQGYPVGMSVPMGSQDIYTAPTAGVVVYSKDGYEEKTADSLTQADFDQKSYQSVNLLSQDKISSGDDVYKLIDRLRFSPAPTAPAAAHFPEQLRWEMQPHLRHLPKLRYLPKKNKQSEYLRPAPKFQREPYFLVRYPPPHYSLECWRVPFPLARLILAEGWMTLLP